MIRRENGRCRFLPAGPDVVQTTELVVLVVVVVVVVDTGIALQFYLIQRAATRYWRRASSGRAGEKLLADVARGRLR